MGGYSWPYSTIHGQRETPKHRGAIFAQVRANIEGVSQAAQEQREPGAEDVVDRSSGSLVDFQSTGRVEQDGPREESKDGECSIECDVSVGAGRGVNLATSTEAVQSIEQAGAHETDETQHDDLSFVSGE